MQTKRTNLLTLARLEHTTWRQSQNGSNTHSSKQPLLAPKIHIVCAMLGLFVLFGSTSGCGLDIDWPWEWDETCYDCRSFCEGTEGAEEDNCLAACSECQGYQECFEALESVFKGMVNSLYEWKKVDCDDVQSHP